MWHPGLKKYRSAFFRELFKIRLLFSTFPVLVWRRAGLSFRTMYWKSRIRFIKPFVNSESGENEFDVLCLYIQLSSIHVVVFLFVLQPAIEILKYDVPALATCKTNYFVDLIVKKCTVSFSFLLNSSQISLRKTFYGEGESPGCAKTMQLFCTSELLLAVICIS